MRPFVRAFGDATRGVGVALRRERSLRVHLAAAVLVLVAAIAFDVGTQGAALLALAVGLVIAAELANSALEALADVLHPSRHPEVGIAKDMAAGAVLVAAGAAIVVGFLVLGPAAAEAFR